MSESNKISMSRQWNQLVNKQFSDISEDFLESFRSPSESNKFVAWNPYEKSTRYFKFLLYKVASSMPDSMLEDYKRLSTAADISLGGPLEIIFDGMKINADYYAAVEEYDFLKRNNIFQYINKIVEIGGGFGRTCHVIMTISNIEKYVIVDLEPMLQLSRSYLKRVLPAHIFSRIQFVSSEDRVEQGNLSADLVINIDSMQEMPQSVIDLYMENIVRCAKYFYSKNAVGKYKPQTLGLNNIDEERMQDVFDLGRCRDVIDIFNDDDLRRSTNNYLAAYNPDGETWERCDHKEMEMFPYFVHALYTRKN